jgi:myo-inositol 2-dehydrogenase/D-chiro-inositol 1-dehydrogenase
MKPSASSSAPRREFLKAAAATGVLVAKPQTVFGSQANSTVEVGLVGCGGRGNWIAPFFPEFAGARIVAVADVLRKNLDTTREKLKVGENRAYYGPDAYKELANSKLDAVAIESPPYFHPEQAMAAVDAGKHVFLAKPVAVDVPGCKDILEAEKKARARNLTFWVDFQSRAMPVFQEAAQRIHRGDLGKPAFAQIFYYAGRPSRDRSTPDMEYGQRQVMNFYMDKVIGGDIIVEQNIHVIDMANWFLNAHPVRASGTGGRTDWSGTPYDVATAYDHFAVTFWYPDNVHATFSSHQLGHFSDLCVRVFGIKGAADTHYGGLVRITGENQWMGTEKDDTFRQGAINNVTAFVRSIRERKPIYNADESVNSNLTAILGRMAAYADGPVITWDEMMKSEVRLHADMTLRW